MQNFFENQNKELNTTNPFARTVEVNEPFAKPKANVELHAVKRLNLTDSDVLNTINYNAELEFMEIKMNNLYNSIHQKPQTLDPVSLEKMKIEWEELRDKLYKYKNERKILSNETKNIKSLKVRILNIFKNFNKFKTLVKVYSPKVKQIMSTFKEINNEVEELVNKATPHGEEEIKYGLLVNKIYQASKLNCKLTSEIK